jgi:hypothetical protein
VMDALRAAATTARAEPEAGQPVHSRGTERRTAGGLLPLDGVRPTAISAGVVAREMLKILHDLARVKC